METAQAVKTMHGDELYQKRAQAALPILVRQAHAGKPLTYTGLARELGMPNPRNLNYVLGCIGRTLMELAKSWGSAVPPIQCLVVNKNSRFPGEGFGWFVKNFSKLPKHKQQRLIMAETLKVYAFQRWRDVLAALYLSQDKTDFVETLEKASRFRAGG